MFARRVLDHLSVKRQNARFEEECFGKLALQVVHTQDLGDDVALAEIVLFIVQGSHTLIVKCHELNLFF